MFINDDLFFIEYADSVSYCYEKQQFDAQDTSHILINLGNPLCLSLTEENICLPKYQFYMFIPENKNILKSSPGQKFIYLSLKSGFWSCFMSGFLTAFPSFTDENAYFYSLNEKTAECIFDLVMKMFQKYQTDSKAYYAFHYSWLSEILMGLSQSISHTEAESHEKSVIKEILRYLEYNFTERISIDMLSSHFYISKYYLMRQFKKETGYTIHNYILKKRINYACCLIVNGISPSEACYQSGFTDYSLFFKAFTKTTGFSPSQYQSTLHKKII